MSSGNGMLLSLGLKTAGVEAKAKAKEERKEFNEKSCCSVPGKNHTNVLTLTCQSSGHANVPPLPPKTHSHQGVCFLYSTSLTFVSRSTSRCCKLWPTPSGSYWWWPWPSQFTRWPLGPPVFFTKAPLGAFFADSSLVGLEGWRVHP